MSDDVTIPRDQAQRYANGLRAFAQRTVGPDSEKVLTHLADLLDPPQLSLRDDVADALRRGVLDRAPGSVMADAVLAVVRKRVEGLPQTANAAGVSFYRCDDVLALLGGGDE